MGAVLRNPLRAALIASPLLAIAWILWFKERGTLATQRRSLATLGLAGAAVGELNIALLLLCLNSAINPRAATIVNWAGAICLLCGVSFVLCMFGRGVSRVTGGLFTLFVVWKGVDFMVIVMIVGN